MRYLWMWMAVLGTLSAQVLYEEHFSGGQAQLEWNSFFGLGDTMAVVQDSTTPEGDGWVGSVGGVFAALAYAGAPNLTDYSVEAWVYTVVDTTTATGQYNGLAIRARPLTFEYYYFATEFDADRRLRLYYAMIPDSGMPVIRPLRVWTADEIPGGIPTESGWHRMKVKAVAESLWAYFDGQLLPDCPIVDTDPTALSSGYFGVYAYSYGGTPETRVDGIVVRQEPVAVAEAPAGGVRPVLTVTLSRGDVLFRLVGVENLRPVLEIYNARGSRVLALRPVSPEAPFLYRLPGGAIPAGLYFARPREVALPPVKFLNLQ